MATKNEPLFPPDETMWQTYSSHFEFPLASATSLFLHGLVIGLMAIGGIGFFFTADVEATKPPRMDVVMLEGGGGGIEGLGGEPGLPGSPDNGGPKRTEFVPTPDQPNPPPVRPVTPRSDEPLPQLGLPLIDDGSTPLPSDLVVELQKLTEDADRQVREQMQIPKAISIPVGGEPKKSGTPGTGNPKGQGGLGGSGGGLGLGKKKGPGTGMGGPGGRNATDQEIKAYRWRFDLSGDAKLHAQKLANIGVVIALPDPKGGFVLVTDLNRRPVDMKRDDLHAFKDAVKWYNTKPESVQSLARELQLPFTPKYVVMLLPKDREKELANEEGRYAQEHRRDVRMVQMTLFDFPFRNGTYTPTVLKQQ